MNRYTLFGLFGAPSGHHHALAASSAQVDQPATGSTAPAHVRRSQVPPPISSLDAHVGAPPIPRSQEPAPTLSASCELFALAGRPMAIF